MDQVLEDLVMDQVMDLHIRAVLDLVSGQVLELVECSDISLEVILVGDGIQVGDLDPVIGQTVDFPVVFPVLEVHRQELLQVLDQPERDNYVQKMNCNTSPK